MRSCEGELVLQELVSRVEQCVLRWFGQGENEGELVLKENTRF